MQQHNIYFVQNQINPIEKSIGARDTMMHAFDLYHINPSPPEGHTVTSCQSKKNGILFNNVILISVPSSPLLILEFFPLPISPPFHLFLQYELTHLSQQIKKGNDRESYPHPLFLVHI